jgi:hypothetical protein
MRDFQTQAWNHWDNNYFLSFIYRLKLSSTLGEMVTNMTDILYKKEFVHP